eukprot:4674830-Pleurochrysis_carterae.AAC.1
MNEIGKGRKGAGERVRDPKPHPISSAAWRGVHTPSDFAVVHRFFAFGLEPLHLRAVAHSHPGAFALVCEVVDVKNNNKACVRMDACSI